MQGQIHYLADVVENEDRTIYLEPLPLEGGAKAQPNISLLIEVCRALGFYGFQPDPDEPSRVPDLYGLLSSRKPIPWQLRGPARDPDGQPAAPGGKARVECTVEEGAIQCQCRQL